MDFSSELQVLSSYIERAEKVVVITHMHPDGDAAGSTAALAHYLQDFRHKNVSLIREPLPDTISFIDEHFTPVSGDKAREVLKEADLIFCTDFGVLDRCGEYERELAESKAIKVLADHHPEPQAEAFDLLFSSSELSSASEIVYQLLKGLCRDEEERKALLGGACGYALMCGMTTDTNNFSCSTFPSTLMMASELLAYGINRDEILEKLYNRYRENRVRAFASLLSEHFSIREDGIGIIKVSTESWHKFGLQEGELEGLVNVPLSIDRVKISIYLREDGDTVRVSLRAKKGWSARELAVRYFHGGGHELASGGKLLLGRDLDSFGEIDDYLEKIRL